MSTYLIHAHYSPSGLRGLIQEGGSRRREALTQTVESLNGSLKAMYYAFGDSDAYLIADFPDESSAAAFSLQVNAAGAISVNMTSIVSPEIVDDAVAKDVSYRKPGD